MQDITLNPMSPVHDLSYTSIGCKICIFLLVRTPTEIANVTEIGLIPVLVFCYYNKTPETTNL